MTEVLIASEFSPSALGAYISKKKIEMRCGYCGVEIGKLKVDENEELLQCPSCNTNTFYFIVKGGVYRSRK